jgi:hypothetical protein
MVKASKAGRDKGFLGTRNLNVCQELVERPDAGGLQFRFSPPAINGFAEATIDGFKALLGRGEQEVTIDLADDIADCLALELLVPPGQDFGMKAIEV